MIEKEQLMSLRKIYGEAFYLLDYKQFQNNFIELKKAFSSIYSNFNIAYSYKTNYIPKICSVVNELGGYAEVVSDMEMQLALKVGVLPQNIIWNGPIKNSDELGTYLKNGGVVNIDSIEELIQIKNVVKGNLNSSIRLGIRCNFDVLDGVTSRFGFDIESKDFYEVLEFVTTTPNVEFVNFQCHFAKRQLEYWPARVNGILDIIEKTGVLPKRVDLGGALFGKMDESLEKQFSYTIPNYTDYAKVVATKFKEKFGNNGPELVIEPGTALVGDCMNFVATVKSIKNIRGKYFATILGSQKNINMQGINPPIKVVSAGSEAKKYEDVDIVGFTCIEGDLIFKGYAGDLAVGDIVILGNCGSYSVVMKPPFILPNFPILSLNNGKVEVIKRAETFDDVFQTYTF